APLRQALPERIEQRRELGSLLADLGETAGAEEVLRKIDAGEGEGAGGLLRARILAARSTCSGPAASSRWGAPTRPPEPPVPPWPPPPEPDGPRPRGAGAGRLRQGRGGPREVPPACRPRPGRKRVQKGVQRESNPRRGLHRASCLPLTP